MYYLIAFLGRVAFLLRLSIHLYGRIPLPPERIADSCSSRSIKVTFVGYSQLNFYYYCFRYFASGMYDTSYLKMQPLCAGHIFSF